MTGKKLTRIFLRPPVVQEIDRAIAIVARAKKPKTRTEAERVAIYRAKYPQLADAWNAYDQCRKKPNGAVKNIFAANSLRKLLSELHIKNLPWARRWADDLIDHVKRMNENGGQP